MIRLLALVFLYALIAVLPAKAQAYSLKSGETLANSEYQTAFSLGGGKRLVLEVKFDSEAESSNQRTASFVEILQDHLIPKAVKEGFSRISIWESLSEVSTNKSRPPSMLSLNFTGSAYENYDFDLQDEWIWSQVEGPELDLSKFPMMTFEYDETADVYRTELLRRDLDDGNLIFEVWVNAPDTSPEQLAAKANTVFRKLSGCTKDGVPIAEDSYMAKHNAKALVVYGTPVQYTSPLQLAPRFRFLYGHEDGVPYCRTQSGESLGTWGDIYASLSE
jgi:hypothetical protein